MKMYILILMCSLRGADAHNLLDHQRTSGRHRGLRATGMLRPVQQRLSSAVAEAGHRVHAGSPHLQRSFAHPEGASLRSEI